MSTKIYDAYDHQPTIVNKAINYFNYFLASVHNYFHSSELMIVTMINLQLPIVSIEFLLCLFIYVLPS